MDKEINIKIGSIVYDVAKCNDGKYRCFKMIVSEIDIVKGTIVLVGNQHVLECDLKQLDIFLDAEEALAKLANLGIKNQPIDINVVDEAGW